MNMSIKRHQYVNGVATKTFEELSFKEQAQSITSYINVLERMIRANLRRAKKEGRDASTVMRKRLEQIQRVIHRVSMPKSQ